MDNNIIDEFRTVCLDNIRALNQGQIVFIYRKDVLEKTKELCNQKNIEYEITNEDWYYIMINKSKKVKKDKFYNNKNGK